MQEIEKKEGKKSYLQPRILRHHPLNADAHPFNHSQQTRTPNRAIPRGSHPSPNSQCPTGEKPRDDRIIRILLLPDPFHCTIKAGEQTAPDAKVASQHRGAGFDGCQGADAPFAVGGVAESLDAVPEGAADCAHAEGTAEVGEGYPWAGVSAVVHLCCGLDVLSVLESRVSRRRGER